jgi:hypothetical protein
MKTLNELEIGTVVRYGDIANQGSDNDLVILNSFDDKFGSWVRVLRKRNNAIENKPAYTEIGEGTRWAVISPA